MMRRRLGWEITALLMAKLVLLFALYIAFFSHRAPSDAPTVGAHILDGRAS